MINEFIPPLTVMNQLHGQAQSSLRRQIGRLFLMILSLPLTSLSLATGSSQKRQIDLSTGAKQPSGISQSFLVAVSILYGDHP